MKQLLKSLPKTVPLLLGLLSIQCQSDTETTPTSPPGCVDQDQDGFSTCVSSVEGQDCDDNNPAIHPGATESSVPSDGILIDSNCDGQVAVAVMPAKGIQKAAFELASDTGSFTVTLTIPEGSLRVAPAD